MSGRSILDPWFAFPQLADLANIEARVYAWLKKLPKPRARWNPYGVGYWTVRTVLDGTIYQGVGSTLQEAYGEWVNLMETHR